MQTRMDTETGMGFDYLSTATLYEPKALLIPLLAYKRLQQKLNGNSVRIIKMQIKELPEYYALELKEIGDAGQEDFTSLAESLELE